MGGWPRPCTVSPSQAPSPSLLASGDNRVGEGFPLTCRAQWTPDPGPQGRGSTEAPPRPHCARASQNREPEPVALSACPPRPEPSSTPSSGHPRGPVPPVPARGQGQRKMAASAPVGRTDRSAGGGGAGGPGPAAAGGLGVQPRVTHHRLRWPWASGWELSPSAGNRCPLGPNRGRLHPGARRWAAQAGGGLFLPFEPYPTLPYRWVPPEPPLPPTEPRTGWGRRRLTSTSWSLATWTRASRPPRATSSTNVGASTRGLSRNLRRRQLR